MDASKSHKHKKWWRYSPNLWLLKQRNGHRNLLTSIRSGEKRGANPFWPGNACMLAVQSFLNDRWPRAWYRALQDIAD